MRAWCATTVLLAGSYPWAVVGVFAMMRWVSVCAWLCFAGMALADEALETYQASIRPLFYARCVACHGSLKQEAGLRLDTAEHAIQGGESGPAVVAGNTSASILLQRVTSGDAEFRMPPEGEPLHPAQIASLTTWIEKGAGYPADETGESDPSQHWSFQPPIRFTQPLAADTQWNDNPIDAWISSAREARGLAHQQPASKAVWLRRVSLDLIGLPPTPEELAEFESDTAEGAKERVVDRLLQSPHYGERWGRHWMDILRYSDWWGLGEEVRNSQKHMWHWRDWIIESLNKDIGYDQMIREMLAADELYPNDLQRLRATGYLARQYFKFNRTSWLDETIEHTAKGFLGLTFNCAKCHDHKYDPLTQADYYAFRAIFEPYQVRMEMLPGQSDLSRDGIPRAFDCNLDATTFLHVRGDDRNPDKSRPLAPSIPSFLGGSALEANEVRLPAEAAFPGLRAFVRENLLSTSTARVNELRSQRDALQVKLKASESLHDFAASNSLRNELRLAELELRVAVSELVSIDWRFQADALQTSSPNEPQHREAINRAAYFDRRVDLARAQWKLEKARIQAVGAAADKMDEAQSQLRTAEVELESAYKQVAAPGERYRSLLGAEKTAESNLESEESRAKPFPTTSTGRRSALARWMTDRSNPLVARVAVNHVWARHFGAPLVPTVFDFGRKGTAPVHRELLDFLAMEFIESGWSFKHLHRLMTCSMTYGMASSVQGIAAETLQLDSDNRLYWKMNAMRMEAQVVRDCLLHLSGDLDLQMGGPSIPIAEGASRRRSIYFVQSHNEHEKFLAIFDDANVLDCYRRARSIVPQQALALQNSPLVQSCCEKIVKQILHGESDMSDEAFIRKAFMRILATEASDSEIELGLLAMQRWKDSAVSRQMDASWLSQCGLVRSLLNHNDFVTIR